MDIKKILIKNQQWIDKKLSIDTQYFSKLAKGQKPKVLYIGCSDSRVSAEEMIGAQPGELFVHRNVANQVIVTDSNCNAVIQYAVEYLKVKHIVVCGHYECGGIKAAMHPQDMGELNNWLQGLQDVYRIHSAELNAIKNKVARFDRFVQLNVFEQAVNVTKLYHVQRQREKTGFPKVHGWVFNLRTGKLAELQLNMKEKLAEFKNIYKFDTKK